MSDLDSLLVELESSIERRVTSSSTTTCTRVTVETGCEDTSSITRQQPRQDMATKALSNNINELDILLQDLSAARYSGHVEHHETITESRSYSSHTGDIRGPPAPPERSLKTTLTNGKFSLSNGDHHDVHALERRDNRSLSSERGESKWEYMGYGIWENKDSDEGSESPPPARSWSAEKGMQSLQTKRVQQSYNTSSYREDREEDNTGASSATKELDHLMMSLNTFKMDGRNVDEPVIGGAPNLDMMLGDLQENMNKQGVKIKQKGVCGACGKPIVGQVITALGHTWHPECFTCNQCNQELGTQNFFERDCKPYCENCYHSLYSPRCGACQRPILDKCISALGQTWHPECFCCSGCGKLFGDEGFHERGDAAYCKGCYFGQFAPRCARCNDPITENFISSLNKQWHPDCFVCKECQEPFRDGSFFEHEGFPYCETCYHATRGSLCAMCRKPISGRCITAMFRKFHPECFVCSFCLKQLNKGTFKEQGDKPYCHECFDRLFG